MRDIYPLTLSICKESYIKLTLLCFEYYTLVWWFDLNKYYMGLYDIFIVCIFVCEDVYFLMLSDDVCHDTIQISFPFHCTQHTWKSSTNIFIPNRAGNVLRDPPYFEKHKRSSRIWHLLVLMFYNRVNTSSFSKYQEHSCLVGSPGTSVRRRQ